MRQAQRDAVTPTRALGALIETYFNFAREHPAYLQLLLRPELSQSPKHSAQPAGAGPLIVLTEVVEDCQRAGTAPPGDTCPLVGMVWALAIGLVTLWLDGPLEDRCTSLGTTPELLTAQISALLERLLTGVRL